LTSKYWRRCTHKADTFCASPARVHT